MEPWKTLIPTAGQSQTLARASGAIGKGIQYQLGRGGFRPDLPLGNTADCSGFVAWCLGIPRELPPGSQHWLDTDAVHNGGGDALPDLFLPVLSGRALAGDLIVYPDRSGKQGHIGIVSVVAGGQPAKVIHCSSGNYRNFQDAVRETAPDPWLAREDTRVMRPDYEQLRSRFKIDVAADPTPQKFSFGLDGGTIHPLIADDPTLRRVVDGKLVLEAAQQVVSGIGAVQRAMAVLARSGKPDYLIDLGPNDRMRGWFGPKTIKAINAFQTDQGLPVTPAVDRNFLLSLSRELFACHEEDGGYAIQAKVEALEFSLVQRGRDWYGQTQSDDEFFVAREVSYQSMKGLLNDVAANKAARIDASHRKLLDTTNQSWFPILQVVAQCESQGILACINTYDRARFSFGPIQFAAHVANGDFYQFFRAILQLPSAEQYFPELALNEEGKVCRRVGDSLRCLEVRNDIAGIIEMQRYLNPSDALVEDDEVRNAARLIHWCEHEEDFRRTLLNCSVFTLKGWLKEANLDAKSTQGLSGLTATATVALLLHCGAGRGRKYIISIEEAITGGSQEKDIVQRILESDPDKDRRSNLATAIKEKEAELKKLSMDELLRTI